MTNEEFYKDELKKLLVNSMGIHKDTGKPMSCESILLCKKCVFCDNCNCSPEKIECWLQSEHVEQVDWSKVEVDTPILVRNDGNSSWTRGYFAGYVHETVYAWKYGKTSWTAGDASGWKCAKLAESEEQKDGR